MGGCGPGRGHHRGAGLSYFAKAPGEQARTWESDQILGLERIYAPRDTYSIAAVNMSLGGGATPPRDNDPARPSSTTCALRASPR